MKTILILFVILLLRLSSQAQATIWSEDFESYSDNSGVDGTGNIGDYPTSVTKWTIDDSGAGMLNAGDYLKVNTGFFQGKDLHGKGIWFSESINISNYTDVKVSGDFWRAGGTMEVTDSISFYYRIDGGVWNTIVKLNDDIPTTPQSHSISNLNGSTLEVKVEIVLNAGGAEIYAFDDVLVEGAPTFAPSCTTPISPTHNETDVAVDVDLNWNVAPGATSYRIYFGTDASATNIENGTDLGNVTSYTPATDLDYLTDFYWKIVPYNVIGSASACAIWSFTTEEISYCIPTYATGTGEGDYISLVRIGDIDKTTLGAPSPYYNYYSSESTDLKLGGNNTITLGSGTYSSQNNISVWIDFDGSGTFSTSEKLGNITLAGNSTGTIDFTVPTEAKLGVTRMRVREAWNVTGMDPCTGYTYGETEDYNVNILSDCTDATLTLNTGNSTQAVCESETITDIVYSVGGDATGATLSGPGSAGLTGSFNSGTYTISGIPTATGSYTVTTTGTPSECSEATVTGSITVNSLPTAPIANNSTSTYNGAIQAASASVGPGETIEWYTLETNGSSTTAPSGTDVGIYTAWAQSKNLTTNCVSATRTQVILTINKKDLQVTTATSPNITYGDAEPSVTVLYSGFEGSDDASVLDNTGFILGTDYTQGNPIGIYNTSILIGTASDNNYNFNPINNSSFLVGKKELTVTAGNQNVSYGAHKGEITLNGTYTITGYVNGDNSSVIIGLGSIAYTSNYTETTNVGSSGITITPDILGLSAANYTLVAADGSITIVKADQYIDFDYVPFTKPLNEFDTIQGNAISSSGLPVIITLGAGSAATLNGTPGNYYLTDIGTTGTVTINANQVGNANYNPAAQATLFFDVTKSNQIISFPAIDDVAFYNGLTKTLNAVASSGLPVNYIVESGPATIAGNVLTITGAGNVSVRANQPGDAAFNATASVLQTFTVSKGIQTITINIPPGNIDNTTPITATSTSGLPVTLTLGVGSDATALTGTPGGIYTLSGVGTIGSGFIDIAGNQAGDANFMPAAQVIQNIVLSKLNQTITFNPIADQTYSPTLTINLTATSSSLGTVSFTLVSGPANLDILTNVLSITGVGTVIIEANQTGDAAYNPAPAVTQQFEIIKATPVITLAGIVKTFGDAPFTILPTSISTGSFSFISGDDGIYTISGNTATIVGAGTTVLDVTQQPSANYYGATKTVLFTMNKAASTIIVTGASFTFNGTHQGPETSTVNGSAGIVTYSYEGVEGTGATYGPSTSKPINAGAYAVTASVAEDDNYFGATSIPYDFAITKTNAIVTITPYTVSYDGTVHIAIGSAKGVSAEDLAGLDLSGSAQTLAGIYSYDWDFIDETGNYNDDSGTISNVINTATLSITAIDQSKCFGETVTFNGSEFISAGLIGAETIGSVTLTSTGASAGAGAGTYAITPSGANDGTFNPANYTFTYNDGEMEVNPLPTLTGASQNVPICESNTASINLNGLVEGSTFTVDYSINSNAQTPIAGLVANGSGNSIFSTPVLTAANDGQVLRITKITITSESPNCEETFTEDITLSVNPLPTLTGASLTASVCEGSAATINLSGLVPDSTFTLSYTINGGATIVINGLTADGSGTSSFTTAALALANNGQTLQIIKIEDESSACIQTFIQDILLLVDPNTVGGVAAATLASICENNTTTIELTGYMGTIQWQQSADGTSGWINVSGGSGATTDTYTTPVLTTKTYYRAVVTSGNCVSQNSTITSVTVNPLPTLGGVTQTATVCDGSNATINLSGLLPNTTFTLEYKINGGTAIVRNGLTADASGNSNFTTPVLTIANNGETLIIDKIESTNCFERFTQNLILDVDPSTAAGTASSDQTICDGDTPTDIILAGNTGSVQWQSSPDNSTWTNISGATGTTLTGAQMGSLSNTTYYQAEVTSGVCSALNSNTVTVIINTLPTTAVLSTNSPICENEDAVFALTGTSGATVTYKINTGIEETVVLTGGTATITISSATENQTLNLVSVVDANCSQLLSTSSTIIVNPLPVIGSFN